jgi:hypothetical protein
MLEGIVSFINSVREEAFTWESNLLIPSSGIPMCLFTNDLWPIIVVEFLANILTN